jgi:hypothetical protein
MRRARTTGCLLFAIVVAGCGGEAAKVPSQAIRRSVAERFAAALVSGDVAGARALLAAPKQAALVALVRRAAAPWTTQHARIEDATRGSGNRWAFTYAGTHTHPDGRFERERGELVVFVEPSAGGAGVRYFVVTNVRKRFSTHHDAQLLPSNR